MRTDLCYGIVLAGGLSRRMGGGDKGLRNLGGISLLAHVIEAIRPQCDGLVLNANGDAAKFQSFHLPVVADDVPGFLGPLAGILAGLDWIAEHEPQVGLAASVPSDTPFLPPDLVARLRTARAETGVDLACASSGGRRHPVVALWPVTIRKDLRLALVGKNLRKIERFMQNYSCTCVDWSIEPYDPFFNANSPNDLIEAEAILSRRDKHIA
jgi:molybdenum cofactor guanylyltransferase